MTLQQIKQAFPTVDGDKLFGILKTFQDTKALRVDWQQKLMIEKAVKYIGAGSMNKSCGSCVANVCRKLIKYAEMYYPNVSHTVMPMITKKKVMNVSTKAEKIFYIKKSEIPSNFLKLKSKVEKYLEIKFPKGTGKDQVMQKVIVLENE